MTRIFTRNKKKRRANLAGDRSKRLEAANPEEFSEIVEGLIEGAPWFGEPPFEPTPIRHSPRGALHHQGYRRRVLLSWLVGRPVSQIAKRAGCSTRLAHRVVAQTIYPPGTNGALEDWLSLGLIGVIDTPLPRFHEKAETSPCTQHCSTDTNRPPQGKCALAIGDAAPSGALDAPGRGVPGSPQPAQRPPAWPPRGGSRPGGVEPP